jgi:O-antigen/teichoic acid export membrane protein
VIGPVRAIALHLERSAPAGQRLRLGHRFWGFADQALASGVSFFTTMVAATALDPAEFGTFALALAAIYFLNTLQAGLITRPHNVVGAARPAERYRGYTAATAVMQLGFSLATGVVGVVATVATTTLAPAHTPLVAALALAAIAWQLQEFPRRVLYTESRGRDAFVNDVVSYGGQGVIVLALVVAGGLGATNALLVIAATSAAAAGIGFAQIRTSLARSGDADAGRDTFTLGKWLAAAEAAHWTSTHIYFFIVAALLGPVAAATIRATQILFGPLRIVFMFLYSVLPAAFARTQAREGQVALDAEVRRSYSGLVPVLLLYCAPAAIFAEPLLRLVYQERYAGAGLVLGLAAVQYFFACLMPVAASLLQVEGLARHLFLVQVYLSVASICFGWLLVRELGVEGAAIGMTFGVIGANAYALAVHWRSRRRAATTQ